MATVLKNLLDQMEPDPWRNAAGFSPDIEEAQRLLFDPANDPRAVLSRWLQANQPCLFGRSAAKLGLLGYCILRESDLSEDERVRDLIQSARRDWRRNAFNGAESGFIVLLISERIAEAIPNENVSRLAQRLCSLYLREADITFDAVHHERVCLEKAGADRMAWEWLAGVNYFCAQGDKRWWHDHRIPGGIGFSVNSVGHMIKAARLTELMTALNSEMGITDTEYSSGKIRSLDEALKFAMLTIDKATNACSGKATNLLDVHRDEESPSLPPCPVKLPEPIARKNHCTYQGWYHTDYTLPSEYFRADIERPSDVSSHELDFTYFFQADVDNPAHEVMGAGLRIRADKFSLSEEPEVKRRRVEPREIRIESSPELMEALSR